MNAARRAATPRRNGGEVVDSFGHESYHGELPAIASLSRCYPPQYGRHCLHCEHRGREGIRPHRCATRRSSRSGCHDSELRWRTQIARIWRMRFARTCLGRGCVPPGSGPSPLLEPVQEPAFALQRDSHSRIATPLCGISLCARFWNTTASDLAIGGYREGRAKFKLRPIATIAKQAENSIYCQSARSNH